MMKKMIMFFAVANLLVTASCGQKKLDPQTAEVRLKEGPEEPLDDSYEIMKED